MTMRIGLTGGIAAGKNTVARRLAALGAEVIDYDLLSREVVAPGSVGLQRIVETFGSGAVAEDGTLNRGWMATQVFGDEALGHAAARRRLNGIVHPLVEARAQELDARAALDSSAVIVHDIPLLAEVWSSIPFSFDHVLTVEAVDEIRIARMVNERHMSRAQAVARIASQAPREGREAIADHVIDSSQPIERMFDEVDRLYAQWTARG